jgi:sugar lactone lactonase YvrE
MQGVALLCAVALGSACGGGGSGSGGTTSRQIGGSIQGNPLALTGDVTTMAGIAGYGGAGATDGTTAAKFHTPMGIATDGTNLWVADTNNHSIRKVVIASGMVSTVAGTGAPGSADGTAAAAFYYPNGITTDGTTLYVADTSNHTIRAVVISTGLVTTLAGSAGVPGYTDGTAGARFNGPQSITMDGANLYVADTDNHNIRKVVIATGAVTTVAGAGAPGSTDGRAARFNSPRGITTDGVNLYVADTYNQTIRKIVIATGVVSTLAGSTLVGGATDGTAAARFNAPYGISTDGTNLWVVDAFNHNVRMIAIDTGMVSTVAGSAGSLGAADGSAAARFNFPMGITNDRARLYVADTSNNTIRKIQ